MDIHLTGLEALRCPQDKVRNVGDIAAAVLMSWQHSYPWMTCVEFLWQCFFEWLVFSVFLAKQRGWGSAGVASLRSCQKLPPHSTEPGPAGPQTALLLGKDQPNRGNLHNEEVPDNTQEKVELKRNTKTQHGPWPGWGQTVTCEMCDALRGPGSVWPPSASTGTGGERALEFVLGLLTTPSM